MLNRELKRVIARVSMATLIVIMIFAALTVLLTARYDVGMRMAVACTPSPSPTPTPTQTCASHSDNGATLTLKWKNTTTTTTLLLAKDTITSVSWMADVKGMFDNVEDQDYIYDPDFEGTAGDEIIWEYQPMLTWTTAGSTSMSVTVDDRPSTFTCNACSSHHAVSYFDDPSSTAQIVVKVVEMKTSPTLKMMAVNTTCTVEAVLNPSISEGTYYWSEPSHVSYVVNGASTTTAYGKKVVVIAESAYTSSSIKVEYSRPINGNTFRVTHTVKGA